MKWFVTFYTRIIREIRFLKYGVRQRSLPSQNQAKTFMKRLATVQSLSLPSLSLKLLEQLIVDNIHLKYIQEEAIPATPNDRSRFLGLTVAYYTVWHMAYWWRSLGLPSRPPPWVVDITEVLLRNRRFRVHMG